MAITLNGSTGITTDIDGDESLTLNRDTSDGNIITLQKNNTTVGSIGAKNGDVYISGVTANSGVRFYDTNPALTPCSTDGSDSDASLSLGVSSVRWKNLYLSGGVYVGGTGSANYLDDYEEGTFTPTAVNGFTSFSTIHYAKYTKIGRVVNIVLYADSLSGTSANQIQIGGLPFTCETGGYSPGVAEFSAQSPVGFARAHSNSTTLYIFKPNTTTGKRENYNGSDLAASNHILCQVTYFTT